MHSLAKEKVVQQALGADACKQLTFPVKPNNQAQKSDSIDMFHLPETPNMEASLSTTFSSASSDEDSSIDEKNLRYHYDMNIQAIDVKSSHFQSLPADVRHEILTDIKATRKQSSWGKLHELPVQSNDFSLFQMNRLLKRRQVQV